MGRVVRRPQVVAAVPLSLASQSTPRSRGEQMASDLIQIRQRKHRLGSSQVLGQAPVSHLGESPHLLDDAKGICCPESFPRTSACPTSPPS